MSPVAPGGLEAARLSGGGGRFNLQALQLLCGSACAGGGSKDSLVLPGLSSFIQSEETFKEREKLVSVLFLSPFVLVCVCVCERECMCVCERECE